MLKRLCFCFLWICAPVASAEVIESLEVQEYVVRTDGERSLLAAINRESPVRRDGRIFHAYTKWHVRWNFRWNSDGYGQCKITDAKVNVSGSVLLPKLAGGTGEQRDRFAQYIRNLRTHELGHYEIGKRAAASIDAFLLSLPSRSSCALLERDANEGAYRLLEKHQNIEVQYDVDTSHGKTQGAWLEQ